MDAVFPASTHDNPIYANLTFKKYGIEYDLADFQFIPHNRMANGVLTSHSGSNANWSIEFNSTVDPGRVTVSLDEGVGTDFSGDESKPTFLP